MKKLMFAVVAVFAMNSGSLIAADRDHVVNPRTAPATYGYVPQTASLTPVQKQEMYVEFVNACLAGRNDGSRGGLSLYGK